MIEKLITFYRKNDYIILAVLLGLIIFTIFCPVVKHDFINFDDNLLVYENDDIKRLDIYSIKQFFSKSYHNLYHPLVYVSFALDYKIAGFMDPSVFHTTNLLLHIFNSFLIMFLVYLISKNITLSFFAAVFFAAHPMHVEPVAWVSGRKELLFAFFYLLSLMFYILFKTKDKRKTLFYIFSILMFLCSLFSKVMAVTLPAVLVLYDYIFADNSFGKNLKDKLFGVSVKDKTPFFVLSAVFVVIGILSVASSFDGNIFTDFFRNAYRAAFQYTFYIMKFFIPLNLSIVYPPEMENNTIYKIFIPIFMLFWAYINIWALKHSKKIFFGLMFYSITILPVLNMVPFGLSIPADRFTYIPYFGLAYSLIVAVYLINSGTKKKIALVFLCLFIALLFFLSRDRVGEWQNNIVLFTKAIERHPTYIAYTNRGAAYLDIKEYDLALSDAKMALETDYHYKAIAHIVLASIYKETGDYGKALEEINIALESISYDDAKDAYFIRADIYSLMKQPDKAIEDLRYLYDNYENINYIFWAASSVYEKESKYSLAAYEMDKLLAIEPHNKPAEEHRKKLLIKLLGNEK
ncbi:MAG: tetratricopeptide repeat protein [Endomicrobia bacterium]|nr:tetratricopeptide repeat protein [Endomicrobiia bacterium]MCL2506313.1 tetratricopeptide repeat protein [Endomicrobiia bacterium]